MGVKNSGPFLRGKRGIYYCWIEGNLRSLRTKKPKLAEGIYREMLREWDVARKQQSARKPYTVAQVFTAYLARMESCKPNTLRTRRIALHAFRDEAKIAALPWDALSEAHLAAWLRTKPSWSPSYRRSTINHVQAAYNHCIAHEPDSGVTANPLANMPKPAWRRRKAIISTPDMGTLMEAARGSFRVILTMLMETGARPNELCTARVEHVRGGSIVLEEHKESDSGEDRIIYLSTAARRLVETATAGRAEGPIFLNSRGEPWTPDTLYCRFKRLRKKLGLGPGVFPYAVRGRFTSDAINDSNMNPALVAKQLGHANLQILLKHYLRENADTMQSALDELGRNTEPGVMPRPGGPPWP